MSSPLAWILPASTPYMAFACHTQHSPGGLLGPPIAPWHCLSPGASAKGVGASITVQLPGRTHGPSSNYYLPQTLPILPFVTAFVSTSAYVRGDDNFAEIGCSSMCLSVCRQPFTGFRVSPRVVCLQIIMCVQPKLLRTRAPLRSEV